MCKELDEELEKGIKAFQAIATHLYNMGACKTTQDINIFETPDTFKVTVERIPAKCAHCFLPMDNMDERHHLGDMHKKCFVNREGF